MPIVFNGKAVNGVQFNANYLETAVNCNKVIYNGEIVFDNSGALTLGSIPLGSKVIVTEGSRDYTWILADKNYNGYGFPVLVRSVISQSGVYHSEVPSTASDNKYEGSYLAYYCGLNLSNFSEELANKIITVNVPVKASAASNTESYVAQKIFAPSVVELGFTPVSDEPYEGKPFAYSFDPTSLQHWTRTVVSGQANSIWIVNKNNNLANSSSRTPQYIVPAFCLPIDTQVEENNGYYSLIL